MTTKFKLENAILCEHLVQGLNSKFSLINTYGGDILVSDLPARIAVSIYIELKPVAFGESPIDLRMFLGNKEVMSGRADAVFEAGKIAVIGIPTGLVLIEKPTTLKVTIASEGGRPVTAIKKQIRLSPDLNS